jgi:hypothetical protein
MVPKVAAREVLRIDRSLPINLDGDIIDNDAPVGAPR